MLKKIFPVLYLIVLFTSGCAAKWTVRTDTSETQLLWPYLPEKPKVKYVMSIRGFEESGASFSSVMRAIVFGRGAEENAIVRPVSFAKGRDGRFAIADTGAKAVHLYIPSQQLYRRIFSAKEGEELLSPVGVTFDDASRLYVSDSIHNKVFVFDSKGDHLFSITSVDKAPLMRPTGLAFESDRKLIYVADTLAHKIYAFTGEGKPVSSIGERGSESGQFNFPTHIFWSPAGLLYVTDSMNFRIQIFNGSGRLVTAFGHHGDGSGDFAMPKGVAVDKRGVIYVVDSLFDNIQLFNERGEFLLTLGSRGGNHGEFWLPSGIFIDENDKLYICDSFNQRVQVFQIVGNNHE